MALVRARHSTRRGAEAQRLGKDRSGCAASGLVGLSLDQQKSVSVSAWYLTSLTDAAVSQSLDYGFGVGLAHYFDW